MIIKFIWYVSSFLSILLILISNPKSGTFSMSSSQNNIIGAGSSQIFVQRLIALIVFIFLILTCLSLLFS